MSILYPFQYLRYGLASWWLLHGPRPSAQLIPGQFTLVIDFWEGNIGLNPDAFQAGGVGGVIIRLNSISGGLHKDDLFDYHWSIFGSFIKFPYFVYNPWVGPRANFDWLMANLPPGVKRVGIDIEVKRDGYHPSYYATDIAIFINLCEDAGLLPAIYTGAWFLPLLSAWPNVEYWWARYPYAMYPPTSMNITWEELNTKLEALPWYPAEPGIIPGPCSLWQCSGDRFKLPGTNSRVIDICVFNGSPAQYRAWVGEEVPPPVRDDWYGDVTYGLRALGQNVRDPQ